MDCRPQNLKIACTRDSNDSWAQAVKNLPSGNAGYRLGYCVRDIGLSLFRNRATSSEVPRPILDEARLPDLVGVGGGTKTTHAKRPRRASVPSIETNHPKPRAAERNP
jgi:hypothetical protein